MIRFALCLTLAAAFAPALAQETLVRRTTLVVHDIDASIEFYRDILDFEVWLDRPGRVDDRSLPSSAGRGEPSRFVIMKGPHPWIGMIGLLQYGETRPLPSVRERVQPGDAILMLETKDLKAIYGRMQAAGTPLLRELETTEVTGADGRRWTASFVFAYDPDGHLIELNQPRADAADGERRSEAVVRRRFVDNRWGQLHLRIATPPRGAVSEPPLVLFHQTPLSGRMFEHVIDELARNREVYAIDTPGYGESDPPPEPPSIEEYAAAIGDFLETLPTAYDVMGYHTGVLIAAELAKTRPERVRRAVLVAIPLFDDERRRNFEPSRDNMREDGSHLLDLWESTMRVRPDGQSVERAAEIVAEKQRAGARSGWAGPAIFAYDTRRALEAIRQPVLVLRPRDGLYENTREAFELLADATLTDYDDLGYGFFDSDPSRIADDVDRFLSED